MPSAYLPQRETFLKWNELAPNRSLHRTQAAGGREDGQGQRVNIQCLRLRADLPMTVQSPFSQLRMCSVTIAQPAR